MSSNALSLPSSLSARITISGQMVQARKAAHEWSRISENFSVQVRPAHRRTFLCSPRSDTPRLELVSM
ncbi:hypothetical protein PLICRDRAFT_42745 [Plicaturopsis crispa FD-325 SS-3]|nr:hypothetical protein PLICRDRAFT_42745 [Plicaturopsis crispa FD-325 SS-3]